MSDLQRLIAKLKAEDPGFAERYERGYQAFRLGSLLKEAREQAGMTQEQVAQRLGTKKSAISRIENHAGDMRLSTLQRYAEAVGLELVLELRQPAQSEPAKPARAARTKRVAASAAASASRSRASARAAQV